MKQLIVACLAAFTLASCTENKPCTTLPIYAFSFTTTGGSSISDDSVEIILYQRHAISTTMAAQYTKPILQYKDAKIVDISNLAMPDYYDWKLVLKPSGKTYVITDFHFSDDHVEQSRINKKDVVCYNKVFYTVNNTPGIYDPMQSGFPQSTVILPLPY